MAFRRVIALLIALFVASGATAATLEGAEKLYLNGDPDGARSELQELLAGGGDETGRAAALRLLGQIESDAHDWAAALAAWSELTDKHALSTEAAAVSAAIRPLQALVDCDCDGEQPTPTATAPPPKTRMPPVEQPPAATTPPIPTPAPAPTPAPVTPPAPTAAVVADADLVVVGGWGQEYDAALEVSEAIIGHLTEAGVKVHAGSTEIPAIRGEDVVLTFLLQEAEKIGAGSVLLISTRFGFRDYIRFRAYDPKGRELWKDGVRGGTDLKERRKRGQVSWGLVERAKKVLDKRIGSPGLPN